VFSAAVSERLARQSPLAARLRPRRLDDVLGQQRLLATGRPLRTLIETDRLTSVILWGPPGTGKTTLARLIAEHSGKAFEQLSAVNASVKEVRRSSSGAPAPRPTRSGHDSVPRRDPSLQQGPTGRPFAERRGGLVVLVGATTENPYFEVNPPLLLKLDAVPPRTADHTR
jgi:putative ATPase